LGWTDEDEIHQTSQVRILDGKLHGTGLQA